MTGTTSPKTTTSEDITKNSVPSGTKTSICPGTSTKEMFPAGTENNSPAPNTIKNDIGSGYVGGKGGAGVHQTIINLIPPHEVYIETHLGGASIMKHKKPAIYNIGIDIDPGVINYWNSSPLFKNSKAVPEYDFINSDAIECLKYDYYHGTKFIYCDPPYLMSTIKDRKYYNYRYTEQEHIELLDFLKTLPYMVMISGYYSELYMEMLPGWNTKTYEAMTRGGIKKTEWLWFNYPVPEKLHDYSFIGSTFRERERIKKKRSRWLNRLKQLPPLERNAIINDLLSFKQ